MNCPYCNGPIENGARFCPNCGRQIMYQQNVQPVVPQQPMNVAPRPQSNKSLIIIIIAAASVIICGLLLWIFVFSASDKNKAQNDYDTEIVSENDEGGSSAKNNKSAIDEDQYDWLSEREVTAADLTGKTAGDLRLMRNAIFARHGYKFKSEDLQEYFANFSWYEPKHSDVTNLLNNIEKKNIETIQKFEGGGNVSSSSSAGARKATGTLRNVGFANDYSDWACYSWLTDDDLKYLSSAELRILRNTIYARHGRKFKSADLKNYFSGFSWYNPRYDEISESSLSETERHNIMLIKKYE